MPNLQQVLNEYLTERGPSLRAVTVRQYPKFIQRCFPDWLDLEVEQITKHMCIQRYRELCAVKSVRATSGGKGQADSAFRILGALLTFSNALYDVPAINPVSQFKKIIKPKNLGHREGHIPTERLADWYAEVQKLPPTDRDINLFWILTGCRHKEAAGLRWDEIDFANRVVNLPGSRIKNHCSHRVHLCGFLVLMLQTRKALYGTSPYVFPSYCDMGKPYTPSRRSHQYIERLLGEDVTCNPHALRHTFATQAACAGLDDSDISKLLNHKKGGVTGGYIHLPFEELRPKWALVQKSILEKLGANQKRRFILQQTA